MRIGIDTGGTFTDFVTIRDGRIAIHKEPSTPAEPEKAILGGLRRLEADGGDARTGDGEIVHGSTVATNALLERKGARTALLTTAGFEDVLIIGRQTRRDLYDIFTTRPEPLVPDELRLGVAERVLFDGTIDRKLSKTEVERLVRRLQKAGVESVAVALLFAFANPAHERRIATLLRPLRVPISLSSTILPEYREYERTSTTVINAYLAPVMRRYLGRLKSRLRGRSLRVMQSNGGAARADDAMVAPVRTILSGPAGGVVGAYHIAERSGHAKVITFDMGGTSTDVALVDGQIRVTHESELDGMPIGIPMMDIHTVGAGGGSIASVDAGGALRVGPESAGADPGPICYGRGDRLTVTDANLILGRLLPRFFLGGDMPIDAERVRASVASLPWARSWASPEALAQGVVDVVNSNMEQAIRLISVERGHDTRDFTLVCFGGAGGLHAATLAENLGIPRVVVPPYPGALSALGLLLADARKDYSRTLLGAPKLSAAGIRQALAEMHRAGMADLAAEGFKKSDVRSADYVDVRYRGQSYELTVPFGSDWEAAFHRAHEQRYGYADSERPIEVVSARTTLVGRTDKPDLGRASRGRGRARPIASERVWQRGGWLEASIYDRAGLKRGHVVEGPAIIGEYSSTTFVPEGFRCEIDAFANLVLSA